MLYICIKYCTLYALSFHSGWLDCIHMQSFFSGWIACKQKYFTVSRDNLKQTNLQQPINLLNALGCGRILQHPQEVHEEIHRENVRIPHTAPEIRNDLAPWSCEAELGCATGLPFEHPPKPWDRTEIISEFRSWYPCGIMQIMLCKG